jgi:hypothetical protein
MNLSLQQLVGDLETLQEVRNQAENLLMTESRKTMGPQVRKRNLIMLRLTSRT